MRKRRKGRREVEKEASSKQGIRNGEKMHESVQKDDIINEIPTRNAFLSNVNLTIDKITKANLQRGTDDLNEGIRERERGLKFSAQ